MGSLRIMVGGCPFYMLQDCKTGGKIERLGVGTYRGSLHCLRHSISAVGPKIPSTKAVKAGPFRQPTIRRQIASLALQRHYPVLASIASRSFFLIGELLLGNLSKTVVVVGNAPHDRPSLLVCHLIGNRASFLCTKRQWSGSQTNLLDGMGSGLPRVHWSKEASRLAFAFPKWSPGIKIICYWIISTMVEAIIR